MNLSSGENEGPIVLAGPVFETLKDFKKTLNELAPHITEEQLLVYLGSKVMEANLGHAKCFLVMPRASRSLVYIEDDVCSMYQEVKHMCGGTTDIGDVKRVFIILYQNEDQIYDLYDTEIEFWWNSGPQKELKKFADVNHIVSFKRVLNSKQKEAISTFLGNKKPISEHEQPWQEVSTNTKCTEDGEPENTEKFGDSSEQNYVTYTEESGAKQQGKSETDAAEEDKTGLEQVKERKTELEQAKEEETGLEQKRENCGTLEQEIYELRQHTFQTNKKIDRLEQKFEQGFREIIEVVRNQPVSEARKQHNTAIDNPNEESEENNVASILGCCGAI